MSGDPPVTAERSSSSANERRLAERTLVFTDIVGSTQLKQVLGDREGTQRILRHHAEARAVLARLGVGREISTAGDGMFLDFDEPAMALRFALELQRRLRGLWTDESPSRQVRDRIGIHYGEVETTLTPDGTLDYLGLEVDRASRVMSLAGADQILLSQPAFDRARIAWKESLTEGLGALTWTSHGFHALSGMGEPQELFEVGETGVACLKAPGTEGEVIPADTIAGWRPAVGEFLPQSHWRLEQRLGGSAAEEVWRAVDVGGGGRCILRFCFLADRLERLRRRRELFERLEDLVGNQPHLVRLTGWGLDSPPFYLAYDYVAGQTLPEWQATTGRDAPLAAKLEVVAQLADALEVIHRAGVVHGDLKPGAVVMASGQGQPWARLTRLGLGLVVAEETQRAIQTLAQNRLGHSGPTGPRLDGHFYLAPELLQGGAASPQSDLYALGVVLYQLLVGDFLRPVTADWSAQISHALLQEDLSLCLAAAPNRRLATAGELAVRLRSLDKRREAANEREKLAFLKGVMRTTAVALAVIGLLGWQTYRAEWQKDRARANEREAQERLVRLQVALGNSTQERGDLLGAALFHAEALRLAAETTAESQRPREERLHRLRIGATLHQAPRLIRAWGFPSELTQVALRPGTDQILTAHREGYAQLFDFVHGESQAMFRHGAAVMDAAFVARGSQVLTAGADARLVRWDVATGQSLGEIALPAPAQRLELSPEGRWVAVVCRTDQESLISVFEVETLRPLGRTVTQPGEVFALTFHPAALELATAGEDGEVRRWRLPELDPLPSLAATKAEYPTVVTVQYDPTGERILTASRDHSAGLWNRQTARRESQFWHDTWLTGAWFSRDGSRILTTSFDGTACLWSPKSSVAQQTDHPGPRGDRGFLLRLNHDHAVLQGAISPDQRRIVTACFDHGAWLWNGDSGDPIAQLKHGGYVHLVRFFPDSRRIVTAARDGSLKVWDLGGMAADQSIRAAGGAFSALLRTPDGTRLITAPGERTRQLWDTANWEALGAAWELPDGFEVAALDASGERVALTGPNNQLRLGSARGGSLRSVDLSAVPGTIRAAAFLEAPAELVVLFNGPEDRLVWVPADERQPTRELVTPVGQEPRLFVSPDGQVLVSAGRVGDGSALEVQTRSSHSGQPLRDPVPALGAQAEVGFDPRSSQYLVSPSDLTFDPRSALLVAVAGGVVREFDHDDGVLVGAFSPDGRWLGTASEDGTARLRSLPDCALTQVLGHQHQIMGLAFSPDSLLVATGSRDLTARVWDASTGESFTPPLLHPGGVRDLWFTPDNQHLVTVYDLEQSAAGALVNRWPLIPTDLSVLDVKILTELLSSRRVEALRPAVPLPAGELQSRWGDLAHRHPEVFQVTPQQRAVWHSSEARICARLERWVAAVEHWDEVARWRPLTGGENQEREQARQHLLPSPSPKLGLSAP